MTLEEPLESDEEIVEADKELLLSYLQGHNLDVLNQFFTNGVAQAEGEDFTEFVDSCQSITQMNMLKKQLTADLEESQLQLFHLLKEWSEIREDLSSSLKDMESFLLKEKEVVVGLITNSIKALLEEEEEEEEEVEYQTLVDNLFDSRSFFSDLSSEFSINHNTFDQLRDEMKWTEPKEKTLMNIARRGLCFQTNQGQPFMFSIHKYTTEDLSNYIGFSKLQFSIIVENLKMPDYIKAEDGSFKCSKEEGLFISLLRVKSDAGAKFLTGIVGRDTSQIYAISNCVYRFVKATMVNNITLNGKLFTKEHLEDYSDAINTFQLENFGENIFEDAIVGFIDGSIIKTAVPTDLFLQQDLFTAAKTTHGFKFHAIVLPNGFVGHVTQLTTVRNHDVKLLELVDFETLMSPYLLTEEGKRMKFLGDKGYDSESVREGGTFIVSSRKSKSHGELGRENLEDEKNQKIAQLRIANEWIFRVIKANSPYVYKRELHPQKALINEMALFSILITNLKTAFHPNQITNMFKPCKGVTVEELLELDKDFDPKNMGDKRLEIVKDPKLSLLQGRDVEVLIYKQQEDYSFEDTEETESEDQE